MNLFGCAPLLFASILATVAAAPYFEIQVVDSESGRGVPMVELEMVNHAAYLTDSAGRAAILEPGLEGQTVFFNVRSHGYEFARDGFGMAGTRIKVIPGGKEVVKIKRINIAERLYRVTGQGIYRDSILLGYKPPIADPLLNAQVMGQDSIQRIIYHDKIFWFWGDTLRVSYPLGNFRMSGATSDVPGHGGLSAEAGINLHYFTNSDGFAKGMFPIEPKGDLIWADGFLSLKDANGREEMIAHYIRLKGLGKNTGRGLAVYNDERQEFEQLATLPLDEKWRFPHGHPVSVTESDGAPYFYFGVPLPNVRVPARRAALLETNAYEAWSCIEDGSSANTNRARLLRDHDGKLTYRWTKNAPPVGPKEEQSFVAAGLMKREEAQFLPVDIETGKAIQLHSGSVNWNPWRKKWISIAVQILGSSMLGEVWYSEADSPIGPWPKARKIVTHGKYSFYNPAHHSFFDRENGRIIYFEGTYTADFSGSPIKTPRYDYNQVMYRLDLADARIKALSE